jgi:L-ascorbate oxidase
MNVVEARRYLFLANESFPGPVIEVDEGDIVRVKVTNKHESSDVSIHWHGMHQVGTPYSDGPAGVTQCSLGPQQSQQYEFTAYPAGTHFWHAHATYEDVDGMSGPFIVRPSEPEPFQYDEERVSSYEDDMIGSIVVPHIPLTFFCFSDRGR